MTAMDNSSATHRANADYVMKKRLERRKVANTARWL